MGNRAVRGYATQTFPVDDTQWWPVRTPIACATWTLRGGSTFLKRTDPDDAATEDQVVGGAGAGVQTTSEFVHARYQSNEIVLWVKNLSGAQVLVGDFCE